MMRVDGFQYKEEKDRVRERMSEDQREEKSTYGQMHPAGRIEIEVAQHFFQEVLP